MDQKPLLATRAGSVSEDWSLFTCGGEGASALTCTSYEARRGPAGAPPSEWGGKKISGRGEGREGARDGLS